ncbi:MAG: hypothetical protein ACFCAD_19370 [Pleurocapsa sp.]
MNTSINLLNISVAEAIRLKLEVNYSRGTSFSDGEVGRQYELNPKADQLFSADYRYGFIASKVYVYQKCKTYLNSCLKQK